MMHLAVLTGYDLEAVRPVRRLEREAIVGNLLD